MPTKLNDTKRVEDWTAGAGSLRLECLPAGACYVCGLAMERSSGGKWLCRACGFLLTCCDP
ncbi:MAG TPA: hypothetical protein VGR43_07480 [Dehalococcoidia bacterium]|jgi:hypothetical protein|nr:hypothetical protein [Dehalococcoidia bacterium]